MEVRTLGMEIRAGRLGFHWNETAGCYLRLAPRAPSGYIIETRRQVSAKASCGEHIVWWTDLRMDKELGALVQVVGQDVYLDVDGDPVL